MSQGFKLNPSFIREVERSAPVVLELAAAAELVRRRAYPSIERIMPRQAQTLEIQISGHEVSLVNTDSGGHIEEFGSAKSPPHAPLRRAVSGEGLRFASEG